MEKHNDKKLETEVLVDQAWRANEKSERYY